MCVSDWRLGRLIRTAYRSESVAAAGTLTVSPNRNRVGIWISTSTPLIVVTSFCTITINGTLFSCLFSSKPNVRFIMSEDGDISTQQFIVTAAGNTHQVGVIEAFLPEEVIQEEMAKFISGYRQ